MKRSFPHYSLEFRQKAAPLTAEQSRRVVEELSAGLPEFNVGQYFGSQPTIFADYDFLAMARAEGDGPVVALLGARWLGPDDERFLYLWTAMVADAYRKTMLFHRVLQFFFEQVFAQPEGVPDLVVTKTYNPIVYSIFKSFGQLLPGVRVYPSIPATAQDPASVALALRITAGISNRLALEADIGVVRGGQAMVAPDFFPRMDQSKDADVNTHFARHLSRADQILCVLEIPRAAKEGARRWAVPEAAAELQRSA